MNFALELVLTSLGMIYLIVIVAEIIWKIQSSIGSKDHGSN